MNKSDYKDIVTIIENTRQRGNTSLLRESARVNGGVVIVPSSALARYVNDREGGPNPIKVVLPVHSARLGTLRERGPVFFDNSLVYEMAKELLQLQSLNTENIELRKQISRLEDEIHSICSNE